MDTVFRIPNASLVLRLIHFLTSHPEIPLHFLTVLHQDMHWVIRLKCPRSLPEALRQDLEAFLLEIGDPYSPPVLICHVLDNLALGRSPVEVMQTYKVAVISHGKPSSTEVNIFRQDFIARLGYCPCNLS